MVRSDHCSWEERDRGEPGRSSDRRPPLTTSCMRRRGRRCSPPTTAGTLGDVVRRHGGRLVAVDRRRRGRDVRRRLAGRRCGRRRPAAHRRDRRPVPLRIGIAAGDVTWEDDECTGLPVVVAATRCRTRPATARSWSAMSCACSPATGVGERCEPAGPAPAGRRPRSDRGLRRRLATGRAAPTAAPVRRHLCRSPGGARRPRPRRPVGRAGRARAGVGAGRGRVRPDRAARRRGRRRARRGWPREFGRAVHAAGGAVLLGTLRRRPRPPVPAVGPGGRPAARHARPRRHRRRRPGRSVGPAGPAGRAPRPRRARRGRRRRWIRRRRATGCTRRSAAPSTRRPPAGPPSSCSTTCTGPGRRRSPCCATSPGPGCPARLLVVGTFRDTSDELTEPLAACLADLRRVDVGEQAAPRGPRRRGRRALRHRGGRPPTRRRPHRRWPPSSAPAAAATPSSSASCGATSSATRAVAPTGDRWVRARRRRDDHAFPTASARSSAPGSPGCRPRRAG